MDRRGARHELRHRQLVSNASRLVVFACTLSFPLLSSSAFRCLLCCQHVVVVCLKTSSSVTVLPKRSVRSDRTSRTETSQKMRSQRVPLKTDTCSKTRLFKGVCGPFPRERMGRAGKRRNTALLFTVRRWKDGSGCLSSAERAPRLPIPSWTAAQEAASSCAESELSSKSKSGGCGAFL